MSRGSICFWLGIALLVGGMGAVLLLLLRYEPSAYRNAVVAPDLQVRRSKEFLTEFSEFWSALLSNDRDFYGRFTDEHINSFAQAGLADRLLPDGISEPRVAFEEDRMLIGFRYRNGLLNTVVSITIRAWLTRAEPNVLILRLERLNAGLVPVSAQWLLERLSEVARQHNIEVSWYRHEGYPTAMVRFQADQARPTLELKAVHFENGTITLHGRSREARGSGAKETLSRR